MTHKPNQGIVRIAKSLQALNKKAVIIYERELDEIVGSGCRDKRRIESTLDLMLGFCCDPDILTLYRKLCRYFYDIDPKATAWHIRAYRDMWDPEEKKEWLKDTQRGDKRGEILNILTRHKPDKRDIRGRKDE